MIEIRRYPGISCVAAIAIVAAGYVRWVFSNRDRIVVTGVTGTQDLCVIHHQSRLPERCAVAIFTDIRRLDVVQILTGRIVAIVTATATANDIGMIENCWHPCIGSMAIIAVVATREMRWGFT